MDQPSLNFNPPPKPAELFKPDSQNYRVYDRLCSGGLTTGEMMDMRIACYTHRISDIREKLKSYGLDVVCEPVSKTNNFYRLKENN
jgi:hypothetical protein